MMRGVIILLLCAAAAIASALWFWIPLFRMLYHF